MTEATARREGGGGGGRGRGAQAQAQATVGVAVVSRISTLWRRNLERLGLEGVVEGWWRGGGVEG
jgi:hypothetical protein